MAQKFKRGDRVKVVDPLPKYMSHFHGAGQEAIVIASYDDQFGKCKIKIVNTNGTEEVRKERHQYTLIFKDRGETSWYDEELLTSVSSDTTQGIKTLRSWRKKENNRQADIQRRIKSGELVQYGMFVFSKKQLAEHAAKAENCKS